MGARPRGAARGAVLAGRGFRRRGQSRRPGFRARHPRRAASGCSIWIPGEIRPLRGRHDGPVFRMRFTPDGRTLVTSGEDGQVLAWDVERGGVAQRFTGHTGDVDGLDLTGDGRTLITASVDTRAILWDLAGDRRLDRRFAVGRRFDVSRHAERDRGQPRRAHPRPHPQRRDGRPDRHPDPAATGKRARDRRPRPLGRLQPRRSPARGDGRGRATHALECADAGAGRRAQGDAGRFPGACLLTRRQAAGRRRGAAVRRGALGEPQPQRVWDVRRRTLTGFRGEPRPT